MSKKSELVGDISLEMAIGGRNLFKEFLKGNVSPTNGRVGAEISNSQVRQAKSVLDSERLNIKDPFKYKK